MLLRLHLNKKSPSGSVKSSYTVRTPCCSPVQSMTANSSSTKYLYHLAPAEALQAAKASGQPYTPATYQQDGFIHLTGDPLLLLGVANHFYRSSPGDWLLLVLQSTALTAKVVWEPAAPVGTTGPPPGAEVKLFPHLYGPLNLDAVLAELPILRDDQGAFLQIQGLAQYSDSP